MDVGVVSERMREDRRGAWRVEEGREGRAGAAWGLRLGEPSWELPLGSEQRPWQGLWLSQ